MWRWIGICLICWAGLAPVRPVAGEISREEASRLAVDVVLATNSRELQGSVVHRGPQEVSIAVRREWLRQHEPAYFEKLVQQESTDREEGRELTRQRIGSWLDERRGETGLEEYLQGELDRLREPPQMEAESEFLLVKFKPAEVRRVYQPQPRQRKLAAAAWDLGVADVESTRFPQLEKAVAALDPNWEKRSIDLSSRLPSGMPQSAEEWTARQAIIEQRLVEKSLEFQGIDDVLIPVRNGQPVNVPALLPSLLGNSSLLSDLTGAPRADWRQIATSAAERAGLRSVRVTRVVFDTDRDMVSVECVLLGRTSVVNNLEAAARGEQKEDWRVVWQKSASASSRTPRPGALDQVRSDPQVIQIIEATRALGLDTALDEALAVGAVVLDVNQEVQDAWLLQSDRLLQRIDAAAFFNDR